MGTEPEEEVAEPRMLGADEAGAMFAVLVNVEFVRDAVLAQRGGVEERVLDGYHFVFVGLPEEDGGRPGRTWRSLEVLTRSSSPGASPSRFFNDPACGCVIMLMTG